MLWIPVQLWSLGCYKLHWSFFMKQSHFVRGWVNIELGFPLSRQISIFLWTYPQMKMKIFNFCFKFFSLWAITRIPQHRQLKCNFREAEIAQILSWVRSTISHLSSPYSMDACSQRHRQGSHCKTKDKTKPNIFRKWLVWPCISHFWHVMLIMLITVDAHITHLAQVTDPHLMNTKFCSLLTVSYIGKIFQFSLSICENLHKHIGKRVLVLTAVSSL